MNTEQLAKLAYAAFNASLLKERGSRNNHWEWLDKHEQQAWIEAVNELIKELTANENR
jgi:hypothetical protein